jgi:hypothetical protein
MRNNILGFDEFKKILESKKENTDFQNIVEDIDNILDTMFDKAKKPEYKVDSEFLSLDDFLKKQKTPTAVRFEVTEQDYKISYTDVLNNEYTSGVLSKRKKDVELKFKDKWEDEETKKLFLEFDVELKDVTPEMIKKAKKDDKEEEQEVQDDEKLGKNF